MREFRDLKKITIFKGNESDPEFRQLAKKSEKQRLETTKHKNELTKQLFEKKHRRKLG
jgi:hypothetical protein